MAYITYQIAPVLSPDRIFHVAGSFPAFACYIMLIRQILQYISCMINHYRVHGADKLVLELQNTQTICSKVCKV